MERTFGDKFSRALLRLHGAAAALPTHRGRVAASRADPPASDREWCLVFFSLF